MLSYSTLHEGASKCNLFFYIPINTKQNKTKYKHKKNQRKKKKKSKKIQKYEKVDLKPKKMVYTKWEQKKDWEGAC